MLARKLVVELKMSGVPRGRAQVRHIRPRCLVGIRPLRPLHGELGSDGIVDAHAMARRRKQISDIRETDAFATFLDEHSACEHQHGQRLLEVIDAALVATDPPTESELMALPALEVSRRAVRQAIERRQCGSQPNASYQPNPRSDHLNYTQILIDRGVIWRRTGDEGRKAHASCWEAAEGSTVTLCSSPGEWVSWWLAMGGFENERVVDLHNRSPLHHAVDSLTFSWRAATVAVALIATTPTYVMDLQTRGERPAG